MEKIPTAAERVTCDFESTPGSVNRSIHFPAFVFVLLFALLFLFSGQLSRFSIPRATFEPERASDRAFLEKIPLSGSRAATKDDLQPDLSSALAEIRRRFSGVDKFSTPVELKPPVSDRRTYSSAQAGLNKVAENQGGGLNRPKNQARPNGSGLRGILLTRTHSRPSGSVERRPGRTANGASLKRIRNEIRRFERRLTRLFRPMRRRGRYVVSSSR